MPLVIREKNALQGAPDVIDRDALGCRKVYMLKASGESDAGVETGRTGGAKGRRGEGGGRRSLPAGRQIQRGETGVH